MKLVRCLMGIVFGCASVAASAQNWAPQKNVEIVVGSAPGGSNDNTARTLERIFSAYKLIPSTVTVVNKPGGGAMIANTYVSQRAKDPHYLLIAGSGIASNHIIGASPLTVEDFTPIASLVNDYAVYAVNAKGTIKSGKDLAERLRKDARSVTLGFANAFGSTRHIGAGLLIKALGGNPRDLKPVVFKGSADAITAMLGGHLELVVVGAVNAVAHVGSGRMHVVAVSSPQRLSGPLAHVPTWREQGVDLVQGSTRGIYGPRGLTPAQLAFWENALRRISESPEWKADLEKNYWADDFATGVKLRKDLAQEYAEIRVVLTDLGLAK